MKPAELQRPPKWKRFFDLAEPGIEVFNRRQGGRGQGGRREGGDRQGDRKAQGGKRRDGGRDGKPRWRQTPKVAKVQVRAKAASRSATTSPKPTATGPSNKDKKAWTRTTRSQPFLPLRKRA